MSLRPVGLILAKKNTARRSNPSVKGTGATGRSLRWNTRPTMKGNRVLTAVILAVIGIPAIYFGGIRFFIPFAALISVAAWEPAGLFRAVGVQASGVLAVISVFLVLAARVYFVKYAAAVLALCVAAAMVWHLLA